MKQYLKDTAASVFAVLIVYAFMVPSALVFLTATTAMGKAVAIASLTVSVLFSQRTFAALYPKAKDGGKDQKVTAE